MLAAKHAMGSENEVEAEDEQAEGQTNGQTTANPQLSYIEAYTNSIQAFTHLIAILTPSNCRQWNRCSNWTVFVRKSPSPKCSVGMIPYFYEKMKIEICRKERQERLQHFGLPPHSLKMKRTVSLPNAISNSTTVSNIFWLKLNYSKGFVPLST